MSGRWPRACSRPLDELHPALSPDGRFLAFTRMRLLPKLNGDIVPPAQRTLVSVNLQTGAIQTFGAGGVGPTYTQREPGTVQLSWAAQPDGADLPAAARGQGPVDLGLGAVHRQALTFAARPSRIASARSACRRLAPSATPCIQ